MTQPMLEVDSAVKAFGTVTALSGVDLAVPAGRIAALLGREPLYLAVWLVILSVVPGLLAVRRWQSG